MSDARKARDLQRDPRFALHSGSDEPDRSGTGDAKLAGVVEEITDPERVREINGEPAHSDVAPVPARPARGLHRRARRGARRSS